MSQYKTLKRLSFSVFGLPTAAAGVQKQFKPYCYATGMRWPLMSMRHNFRLKFPSL